MKLKMQENKVVNTIKDHKEWFAYHVLCRLLNPLKLNIGKMNKVLLGKTNSVVLSNTKINLEKYISRYYLAWENHRQTNFIDWMFWFGNFYPYIPSNGDDGLGILKTYQGIKQREKISYSESVWRLWVSSGGWRRLKESRLFRCDFWPWEKFTQIFSKAQ